MAKTAAKVIIRESSQKDCTIAVKEAARQQSKRLHDSSQGDCTIAVKEAALDFSTIVVLRYLNLSA